MRFADYMRNHELKTRFLIIRFSVKLDVVHRAEYSVFCWTTVEIENVKNAISDAFLIKRMKLPSESKSDILVILFFMR